MAALSLKDIENDFAQWLPTTLIGPLLGSYTEIKENFYLGKHEPAELNAGKLCEVVFRILEQEAHGKHTPLGTSVKPFDAKCRSFESVTTAKESVRFHLPRLLVAVYDIRNKRGVGHVGGEVNPNVADATLVATAADWVMAELIRLHYGCSLAQAQQWVDGLVQRRLPLVYEVGGKKRVLNPALGFQERVLLLLAGEHPGGLSEGDLLAWTEHSNGSSFRSKILGALHKKKLIERHEGTCSILPPGLRVVEDNYSLWSQYTPALGRRGKR